jgi:Leucine-rich repeat (LRR) protein
MSEEVLEEISLSKSANFQSDKYYEEDIHQDFQNSDIDSKNEDTDESKTVRFNFKGIITLHDEIFSEIDMQEAQKLDLSFNQIQLKQFEQLNGMLEKLITLILKENKVTAIDFSFDCLPNLLNLDLSLNRIERISPQAFKNIKSLKQLNLARNKLTQLNDEVFSGLSSLEVLKLDKNSIESIQQNSFSELANLRMLDLSNNKLTLLDDLIFRSLENITELNLNGNSIANLSSVLFEHLTKISILVLSNNQIEKIK